MQGLLGAVANVVPWRATWFCGRRHGLWAIQRCISLLRALFGGRLEARPSESTFTTKRTKKIHMLDTLQILSFVLFYFAQEGCTSTYLLSHLWQAEGSYCCRPAQSTQRMASRRQNVCRQAYSAAWLDHCLRLIPLPSTHGNPLSACGLAPTACPQDSVLGMSNLQSHCP